MSSARYDSTTKDVSDGVIQLGTTALKVMLVTGYTYSAAHANYTDVSAHEITGVGYTATGQVLGSVTGTTASNKTTWTATNPQWTGATISAIGAIVYASSGGQLVSYIDFGGTVVSTGATFTITSFSTNGFLVVS